MPRSEPPNRPAMSAVAEDELVQLADMFRLLGDPTRLRVLVACLASPLSVSEIAATLGLTLSLVSHHLRLLRAARLVRSQRQGRQVFYEAADAHVSSVITDLLEHISEPAGDAG